MDSKNFLHTAMKRSVLSQSEQNGAINTWAIFFRHEQPSWHGRVKEAVAEAFYWFCDQLLPRCRRAASSDSRRGGKLTCSEQICNPDQNTL